MEMIQKLLRERLQMINFLLVIGGFSSIIAELLFAGHTNGSQIIGLYAAIFGVLLGLHGLIDASARKFLATAFLLLALIGLVGAFQHFGVRKTRETLAHMGARETGLVSQLGAPPLLAPLSISGLALLGTFTVLASVAGVEKPATAPRIPALTVRSGA